MFDIIKRPVFTEKATRLLEKHNQYVFDVNGNLTKPQIRLLIERIFSVQVKSVNTNCPPRKKRRGGRSIGFLPKYKRAFVTVTKEEKIVFFPEFLPF